MKDLVIKLCYRKIIDINSVKPWDKLVFEDSYLEYRMQAQNLSTKYLSYGELLQHMPEARDLAQRVVPAVTGYVQQLNEVMPDILNNLGRRFVKFKNYQLEIINSHLDIKEKHQVAINFFSEPMIWFDTIDNFLLVAATGQGTEEVATHLMQLQPYLSIHSIKQQHEYSTVAG